MIMLTKEQLADLLRKAHVRGYAAGQSVFAPMTHTETFHDARERSIQPLVHRSSGGHDNHGLQHALGYMTSCTLATVSNMAGRKKRSLSEYRRQISIAQAGCDWLFGMKSGDLPSRVQEVAQSGSVAEWAKQFEVAK